MPFPWHHFGCICFAGWFVYSFMGASSKTKLAALKIFTHLQVTGSSGCFFRCGGQVHMSRFSRGSVLLFGCVCIQLAILSLWHLGITHSLGSLRWSAQSNRGVEVAHHFWLSRCRSKLLLTDTKIAERTCVIQSEIYSFQESWFKVLKQPWKVTCLLFLLLQQVFHLICFFMFFIHKSETELLQA